MLIGHTAFKAKAKVIGLEDYITDFQNPQVSTYINVFASVDALVVFKMQMQTKDKLYISMRNAQKLYTYR